MTSDEIMLELFLRRKKGISMTSIARGLNPPCSRQAVSGVINRATVSKRIMRAVAEAINEDVETVFPEYFAKKDDREARYEFRASEKMN